MLIISDTSPINCLIKINRLPILQQLFTSVVIPPSVYQEIASIEKIGYDVSAFKNATWIEIKSPVDQNLIRKLNDKVDLAEAEAIVLAKELNADLILIDERKGTLVARDMGLRTVGLIGIIIRAKNKNLVTNGKPILDELRTKHGFYISEPVYSNALQLLNE